MKFYKVCVEDLNNRAVFLGEYDSIKAAAASRQVSGDLIVFAEGPNALHIVTDMCWLWGWEIADPQSYARKKIAERMQVPDWLPGGEPR